MIGFRAFGQRGPGDARRRELAARRLAGGQWRWRRAPPAPSAPSAPPRQRTPRSARLRQQLQHDQQRARRGRRRRRANRPRRRWYARESSYWPERLELQTAQRRLQQSTLTAKRERNFGACRRCGASCWPPSGASRLQRAAVWRASLRRAPPSQPTLPPPPSGPNTGSAAWPQAGVRKLAPPRPARHSPRHERRRLGAAAMARCGGVAGTRRRLPRAARHHPAARGGDGRGAARGGRRGEQAGGNIRPAEGGGAAGLPSRPRVFPVDPRRFGRRARRRAPARHRARSRRSIGARRFDGRRGRRSPSERRRAKQASAAAARTDDSRLIDEVQAERAAAEARVATLAREKAALEGQVRRRDPQLALKALAKERRLAAARDQASALRRALRSADGLDLAAVLARWVKAARLRAATAEPPPTRAAARARRVGRRREGRVPRPVVCHRRAARARGRPQPHAGCVEGGGGGARRRRRTALG